MIVGMVTGKSPKTGATTEYAIHCRKVSKRNFSGIYRRSCFRTAVAGLAMIALGIPWILGIFGCTANVSSGRFAESSGAFFPNARQSPLEISRLLRNAHYYKLMGRPELALKELEEACRQNPDNLKLIDNLAQSYEELGNFEAARKIYQEALIKTSSHPALANNLCFTYYLEGRWQEAETCYRQTLARDPGNEAARNNLGLLYCRLGRQDEARRLWQESEGSASAEYKARQALAALGMADRAVYAECTEPAPSSVTAASPVAPSATQKVAMQLPSPPVPDPNEPVEVQEQTAPLQTSPVEASVADQKEFECSRPDLTAQSAPPFKNISPPKSTAVPSPAPATAPGTAPQKSAGLPAPEPAPEKALPNEVKSNKAKSPAPEYASPATAPPATLQSRPAPLTCAELIYTGIEVRNGTPTPNLARGIKAVLEQEAFTVTRIGNHIDFDAKKTMIYYRPKAQKVAETLKADFFPMAGLAQTDKLSAATDIKVLLGYDLEENQDLIARLYKGKARPTAADTASIEILNGTRTRHLAQRTRLLLDREGFSVARIGNYINFGAKRTIIYFRPEAEKVARSLGETLFMEADLEPSTKLRKDIAVRILLGADLMERLQLMARLAPKK